MKKFYSLFLAGTLIFAVSCQSGQKKAGEKSAKDAAVEAVPEVNQLSAEETSTGWTLLFDGTTSNGWRGYNKTEFPKGWEIADGTLHCIGTGTGEAGAENGGDIIYDKKFKNFHLKVEWKIGVGGNSGIFYLGQEIPEWPIYKTAPEMQVLDNVNHIVIRPYSGKTTECKTSWRMEYCRSNLLQRNCGSQTKRRNCS